MGVEKGILHVDGERLRRFQRGAGKDDEEFITAPAASVASACGVLLHEIGKGADDGIADGVAVGIIDRLEMIEVDHDGRERHPDLCIVFDALGEVFFHGTAIEKAGEAVVGRSELESVFRLFQLFHSGADEGRHLQEMGHVLRQVDGVIGDILLLRLCCFAEDDDISRQMGGDETLPGAVYFSMGVDAEGRGDIVVIGKDVAEVLIEELVARGAGENVGAFASERMHLLPDLFSFLRASAPGRRRKGASLYRRCSGY